MKTLVRKGRELLLVVLAATSIAVHAEEDPMANVELTVIPVSDGIHMVVGMGGNLGLSVGKDGTFLIDDQFAPLHDKILAAIKSVSGASPKFVINTHWHFDHTGDNEQMGDLGAVIVAHDNVRERMSKEYFSFFTKQTMPPSPDGALPVVTFTDEITFHLNSEEIEVVHVAPAHTDGDSFVHFKNANVIHTGDLFFNGIYPFIDPDSGGHIGGVIDAVELLLQRSDDRTKIIPGHGPLSNKAELAEYLQMLKLAHSRIQPMVEAGKSAQEVVAAKPTADLDEKWGKGFLQPDVWVEVIYNGIAKRQ